MYVYKPIDKTLHVLTINPQKKKSLNTFYAEVILKKILRRTRR